MYDYDDVCDNRPDYFYYDDPYDIVGSGMVSMVEENMECVTILTVRMFLVVGPSSTEPGFMTSRLML